MHCAKSVYPSMTPFGARFGAMASTVVLATVLAQHAVSVGVFSRYVDVSFAPPADFNAQAIRSAAACRTLYECLYG